MSHEQHHHHHHKPFRIEAVTVCVGYDDFLVETVKENIGLFDRWIIVTSKDDEKTRDVARRFSLPTVISEDHHRDSPIDFNKGRLIERGLQHTSAYGWRVHIDADIILPRNFRNLVQTAHLSTEKIYGMDRLMCKSREHYEELKKSGWYHGNDYHCRVNFPKTNHQVGSRWSHHSEGYVPIGFFQMWHSDADLYKGARVRPYPIHHNDACRTDVQHGLQWDRDQRELLPEMVAIHLESHPAPLGANWNGRTTRRF